MESSPTARDEATSPRLQAPHDRQRYREEPRQLIEEDHFEQEKHARQEEQLEESSLGSEPPKTVSGRPEGARSCFGAHARVIIR